MKSKKILGLMLAGVMLTSVMPQVSFAESTHVAKIDRISGVDRYKTSVEVSKRSFEKAYRVVLASGETYADALVAGNLAKESPILLAQKNKVSKDVLNEIKRLGAKEVAIIGGENSIGKSVEKELKGVKVIRISGHDRYETSEKLYKQLKANSKGVVLASGKNYADALAASPLAESYGYTVVLTNGKDLPKNVKPHDVKFVMGGEKSVNIKGLPDDTMQLMGTHRYETAELAMKQSKHGVPHKVVVTSGENFADALTATSMAEKEQASILLINKTYEDLVVKYVDMWHEIEEVTVVGGEKSVTKQQYTRLEKAIKDNAKENEEYDKKDEEETPDKPNENTDKPDDKDDENINTGDIIIEPGDKPNPNDNKDDETKPEDNKDQEKPDENEQEDKDMKKGAKELLKARSKDDSDLSNFDINTPLSKKEKELVKLVNDYRISKGLKPLNVSKSLTFVARTHNKDQILYYRAGQKDEKGNVGNLHSWSNHGNWKGGMYNDDANWKEIMWNKPKELTPYQDYGFEISMGADSILLTPEDGLDGWQHSPKHNDVILGNDNWDELTIMGVSMHEGYSDIWFGADDKDPAGFHITYKNAKTMADVTFGK